MSRPKVEMLRPAGLRQRELDLWVVGLNHQTAPVELREKLAFPAELLGPASKRALGLDGVAEAVVISTCNRVEVIAAVKRGTNAVRPLVEFLAAERAVSAATLAEHRYAHQGKGALRHLFRVSSSLDSMMVGEPQILGQLKDQFREASANEAAGTQLRRCFERAFSVAKRVRTETGVASRAVSVSSAAVELARRIFDGLGDKTAMLIGAGKMSELAARSLLRQGIASVIVTNRSFDRAVELARSFGGTSVPFDRFPQYLHLADVVIGSVAAAGYVVSSSHLNDVLRARRRKPMFFIDLGVPRNFDPAMNDLENVYLYNIDDLVSVADDNRAEREREALRAEGIVEDEAERFWASFAGVDVSPTIVALRERTAEIARREVERAMRQMDSLNAADRSSLDAMTQAIVAKLLHSPMTRLKHLARDTDEGEAAARATEVLQDLFDLKIGDSSDHED